MPVLLIEKDMYRVSNGMEFHTLAAAQEYEATYQIKELLEAGGIGSNSNWTQDMILRFIMKNGEEFFNALKPVYGDK